MNTLKLLAIYSSRLSANDLKALMTGYSSFLTTGKIDELPKSDSVALNLEILINTIIDELKDKAEEEKRIKALQQERDNAIEQARIAMEQAYSEAMNLTEEETPEEKKARISKARSEAARKANEARWGKKDESIANPSQTSQNIANESQIITNITKPSQNEFCDICDKNIDSDAQNASFATICDNKNAENEAKNTENEAKSSSLSFSNFSFSSLSGLLFRDNNTNQDNNIIQDNNITPSARTRTRGEPPKIDLGFVRPDYLPIVEKWLEYKKTERKETYKTTSTLKTMYEKLLNESGGNPQTAQLMIDKAIANRSQGFYPVTTNQRYNGTAAQRDHEIDLNDGRKREYRSTI